MKDELQEKYYVIGYDELGKPTAARSEGIYTVDYLLRMMNYAMDWSEPMIEEKFTAYDILKTLEGYYESCNPEGIADAETLEDEQAAVEEAIERKNAEYESRAEYEKAYQSICDSKEVVKLVRNEQVAGYIITKESEKPYTVAELLEAMINAADWYDVVLEDKFTAHDILKSLEDEYRNYNLGEIVDAETFEDKQIAIVKAIANRQRKDKIEAEKHKFHGDTFIRLWHYTEARGRAIFSRSRCWYDTRVLVDLLKRNVPSYSSEYDVYDEIKEETYSGYDIMHTVLETIAETSGYLESQYVHSASEQTILTDIVNNSRVTDPALIFSGEVALPRLQPDYIYTMYHYNQNDGTKEAAGLKLSVPGIMDMLGIDWQGRLINELEDINGMLAYRHTIRGVEISGKDLLFNLLAITNDDEPDEYNYKPAYALARLAGDYADVYLIEDEDVNEEDYEIR